MKWMSAKGCITVAFLCAGVPALEAAPGKPAAAAAPVSAAAQGGTAPLVDAMLANFREECEPLMAARKESGFFSFFSRDDKPTLPKCVEDLGEYVLTFWDDPKVSQGLTILAGLNKANGDTAAETAALAKLVYLHKDSEWSTAAAGRLGELGADKLKNERAVLELLAKGVTSPKKTERHFQFVVDFGKLESEPFLKLVRRECDDFIRRYPDHTGIESILSLREGTYVNEKRFELAASGLRRIVALYPDSVHRPSRMLALGAIYEEHLKQYEKAVEILGQIIVSYPDKSEALTAYQRTARLYQEQLKQSGKAVETLDTIVARYPKDEAALKALEYQAKINAESLNDYAAAVKSYQRIADMFPGDSAVTALVKGAELAGGSLKNFQLKVDMQKRIVAEYPKRPEAVEALYDSAETTLEKLNSRPQAKELFQNLIDSYPEHKLAAQAKGQLEKLNK